MASNTLVSHALQRLPLGPPLSPLLHDLRLHKGEEELKVEMQHQDNVTRATAVFKVAPEDNGVKVQCNVTNAATASPLAAHKVINVLCKLLGGVVLLSVLCVFLFCGMLAVIAIVVLFYIFIVIIIIAIISIMILLTLS